jgi:hypothetical protein
MTGVKRRHAAALALVAASIGACSKRPVSWYLMLPPPAVGGGPVIVDLDAPLSEWHVLHPYDTATECDQGRIEYATNTLGENEQKIVGSRVAQQAVPAQRIATDDPRLKEK